MVKSKGVLPCKCGSNRWKTFSKGRKWRCRGVTYRLHQEPIFCGYVREVK